MTEGLGDEVCPQPMHAKNCLVVTREIQNDIKEGLGKVMEAIDTKVGGGVDFLEMKMEGLEGSVNNLEETIETTVNEAINTHMGDLQATVNEAIMAINARMGDLRAMVKEVMKATVGNPKSMCTLREKRGAQEDPSDLSQRSKKHRPPGLSSPLNTRVVDVFPSKDASASLHGRGSSLKDVSVGFRGPYIGRRVQSNGAGCPCKKNDTVYNGVVIHSFIKRVGKNNVVTYLVFFKEDQSVMTFTMKKLKLILCD